MTSVITPRLSGTVNPVPIGGTGIGIIQVTGVAGVNTVTGNTLPVISSYQENQYFSIRFANGNTGAMTLALQGLDAKSLLKPNGSALANGEITTAFEYLIKYANDVFRIVVPF